MARRAVAAAALLAFVSGLALGVGATVLFQEDSRANEERSETPGSLPHEEDRSAMAMQAASVPNDGGIDRENPRSPLGQTSDTRQARELLQKTDRLEEAESIRSRWNALLADPNLDEEGKRLLEKYREAIPRELDLICSSQERERISNAQLLLYALDFERFERSLYDLSEERHRFWPQARASQSDEQLTWEFFQTPAGKDWQQFTTIRSQEIYWERLVSIYSSLSPESAERYFKSKGLHLLFARAPQLLPIPWGEALRRLREGKGPL